MRGLFNPDSWFMRYGAKLWDIMWLNVLVIVCSLPVITLGASLTAMHYVLLKIVRDEESGITKAFFKSFAQNFKQATVMELGLAAVLYLLLSSMQLLKSQGSGLYYAVIAVLAVVVCVWLWMIILQSRYYNPLVRTAKIALAACISHPLRTVLMAVIFILPFFLLLFTWDALLLIIGMGFTLPGTVQAILYNDVFRKLEHDPAQTDPES